MNAHCDGISLAFRAVGRWNSKGLTDTINRIKGREIMTSVME